MPISITRHEAGSFSTMDDVPGPQLEDAITVGNGTVSAPLEGGHYRIKASGAVIVRIGNASLANANGGESWGDGECEVRRVPDGGKIACAAAV